MLDVSGNVNASGSVTAASFAGSGSGLTSLNPTNIAAGTAGISITGNAANAATLGGIAPSGYAPASGSASYVAKAGDTMTRALNVPANGLQVGSSQIVTSGGNVGFGGAPANTNLTDVSGTITQPSGLFSANLMTIDGTSRASSAGQSYLKGLVVNPTYDVTSGYANYLVGIEADPGTKVGSNVAHSVVSFFAGAQPTGGLECSVAFGVNVPNQQTSLCNGSYGFYQGGSA